MPDAGERYFAAATRHMKAMRRGERIDAETQMLHLGCAMASLMMWAGVAITDEERASFPRRLAEGIVNAREKRRLREASRKR